jgi:rhodanese-related sulfurtransferase
MKAILGILLAVALSFSGAGVFNVLADDVPRMSKEDLKTRLGEEGVVVVDVRTEGSWKGSDGKVKGAVREDSAEVQKWMGKYPKDNALILYCS